MFGVEMSRDETGSVIAARPPEMLPGPGLPVPAPVAWPSRREAIRAAVIVATFVGLPAVAAVGAVLVLFALSAAVLVAPLVAAALTWAAWHANRVPVRSGTDAPTSTRTYRSVSTR